MFTSIYHIFEYPAVIQCVSKQQFFFVTPSALLDILSQYFDRYEYTILNITKKKRKFAKCLYEKKLVQDCVFYLIKFVNAFIMSAKSNSVKRHENIDAEINSVLAEIKDTDRKIQDLNRRRQTLMTKYEELKDTKIIQQSESAAIVGDWEKGMLVNKTPNENFFCK